MNDFYFKKTIRGPVLYIKHRFPAEYGSWEWRWCKATEYEAQQFVAEVEQLKHYKGVVEELKKTNPEILI